MQGRQDVARSNCCEPLIGERWPGERRTIIEDGRRDTPPHRPGDGVRCISDDCQRRVHGRNYIGIESIQCRAHGRCAAMRQLWVNHSSQRDVLQVHELRKLDGVQLMS